MRVVHVFNQPRSGGGSAAASHATIAALRARGIEVAVFTRDSRELPDGLRGRLQAGASAIYARKAVAEFASLLDSWRPDVVHVNELFPLISPWILPHCTRRAVPVVMTVDDYHLTCANRNHFRAGELCLRCLGGRDHWAVLKNCRGSLPESVVAALHNTSARRFGLYRDHVAHFVAPSQFTASWVVDQLQVASERVTTIPHIVESPSTAVDPAGGTYVAFAGRFVPEKGIHVLLEAMRLCPLPVRLSRNKHHFTTIDLPSDADVVVTSSREELAAMYRGARVLVMPSTWFETFGIVGAEAMSHGVPVVASRIGALENLVDDGVTGLLARPGDPHDLADKLRRVWTDPQLCRRLGSAARNKATTVWSPAYHGRLMERLYQQVLGDS